MGGGYVACVEESERFRALMHAPGALPLDVACLLIAAHFTTGLDVAAQQTRLDELADGVEDATVEGVRAHLFGRLGFHGNRERYDDAENSFLNRVIDRRTGIPITLSVLTMEVGRRVGVGLDGVGMPGHFLVRSRADPKLFLDPFSAGVDLGVGACRRLFEELHGGGLRFEDAFLEPTPPRQIVARILANLRRTFRGPADAVRLATVLRLRTMIPGVPVVERAELAQAYAAMGRFREAADELEIVAAAASDDQATRLRSTARNLRARLN